jgi:HK97 family phage major capsid protein
MSEKELNLPLELTRAEADGTELTIPVSFASDAIIEDHWLGPVRLSMEPTAVDLSDAVKRGIPVLEMHERELPVGRIFNPRIDGNRIVGLLRFSKSEKGRKLYTDCADGIITDTSVGAIITAVQEMDSHLLALRWKPREVSLVDTGADQSVGVNRRHVTQPNEAIMSEKSTQQGDPNGSAPAQSPSVQIVNRNADEAKAILDLADSIQKKYPSLGIMRTAEEFAQFNRPFSEFQGEAWGLIRKYHEAHPVQSVATQSPSEIGMTEREQKNFSIVRAAMASLTNDWKRAGFELECSRAVADQIGREPRGFFVPSEIQRQMGATAIQRTQSAGDPTLGGFIVASDYRGDLFIDALRAQSVAMAAGVRALPGLVGNVVIPKQTGSATFGWIGEGVDATTTNLTFATINMAPRTIAGAVPMTRKLLIQSSPAIEQLVRLDLVMGAALAIDDAIFEGTGAGGEPLGIKNHASINTQAVNTNSTPTWAEMVGFESEVASDNALAGSLSYVTTPAIRGALKTTSKDTGSGLFIMEGNSVNGYPVYVSTQLASDTILFGDWSQILVGFWGVLDIKPDESTLAASGGLVLRAFQDADIGIRNAVAFCLGT